MSGTLAAAIEDTLPPDSELVGGTVTSVNPLRVAARGGVVNDAGALGSYIPVVGDDVQLLRQEATWLVLGSSASGAEATNTVASFAANTVAASTAGAAYVNVTGATTIFTKRSVGSRVRSDASVSCFLLGATNTKPQFGLDFIDTTTGVNTRFNLMTMLINPVSTHTALGTNAALFSGIPAGTYTVQLLWLRAAGAATLNINTDDWVSFVVAEVA